MTQEQQSFFFQEFRESELLFDEKETRAVLEFFFPTDRIQIYKASITNELRAFAQGLLVAAIDASYAMGYVEIIFKSTANPASSVKSVINKLVRKGAQYWFKNRRGGQSLSDVKIYESVRVQLSRSFRSPFQILLIAKSKYQGHRLVALINYPPAQQVGTLRS